MRLPASPPKLLRAIYPHCTWSLPNPENKIYLTFDDGPTPEVLPFILKTLDTYKIKATFFCVGDNIKKHTSLYKQLTDKGHVTGNHTYNHLSGWKTKSSLYYQNIEQCAAICNTNLFRPPYGHIRKSQSQFLTKKYHIIMWDVLSYDYDKTVTPLLCYRNVIDNTQSGSVIVFHDNVKAYKNLQYALPRSIAFLQNKGFVFDTINLT